MLAEEQERWPRSGNAGLLRPELSVRIVQRDADVFLPSLTAKLGFQSSCDVADVCLPSIRTSGCFSFRYFRSFSRLSR